MLTLAQMRVRVHQNHLRTLLAVEFDDGRLLDGVSYRFVECVMRWKLIDFIGDKLKLTALGKEFIAHLRGIAYWSTKLDNILIQHAAQQQKATAP